MEILPPLETFAPLQPPATSLNGALTKTDATGPRDPGAAAESRIRADHEEQIAGPEPASQPLEPRQSSRPIETAVEATPELLKDVAQKPEILSQRGSLEDSPLRDAVESTLSGDNPAEATQSGDTATTGQETKQIQERLIEHTEIKEAPASESETGPFHESEVNSGAVQETAAESRDSPHPPQEGDSTNLDGRKEGLPQPAEPTDIAAGTDSSPLPNHASSEPRADDQSLGQPIPGQDPGSLTLTLKYRSESAQPAETAGASPESSSSTLDMAITRASGAQTRASQTEAVQTEAAVPEKTQTPQPEANVNSVNFTPGLYARERNTRRAATKAFREPVTPKKQQPILSDELAEKLVLLTPQPKPEARPAKRKAPEPKIVVAQKKRKGGVSSKARPSIQNALTTDQLLALATSKADPEQQRPLRDQETDEAFAKLVCEGLEVQVKARTADMGKRQAVRILDLLGLATYPSEEEALFLTTEEATAEVAQGRFTKRIIVTTDQQGVPLQNVDQFLGEYYDDDALVWIQDPEVKPTKKAPITRQVKISQVKQRFAAPPTNKPWNLLELATHCDDGLRPIFLSTEDCRLLTKLKIPESHAGPEARRRTYLPGYKEVEKWALVAEAGALTEPHQDSHGYSTFITVNTGLVGFGWLSNPTKPDRDAWRRNPSNFRGGSWRYIVLKPGQTVYFPAGTVHFVFRLPAAGNTLAFGGHILRCSNIVHWVRTLLEERDQKEVTNEDLTDSAPGYLARVEKFVLQARVNGTMEKWGGEESIEEFLRLRKEFLSRRQK